VDLSIGECIAEVPAVDVGVATVSVVDCATPHRAEVYLLAPVAVDAAIADVGDQACAAGVDAYTGGGRGDLSITYLIDSKQDRTGAIPLPSTVICLLQDAEGAPLTASVRG
jgi:non-ribosomal peptide synthetase component F